MLEIHLSDTAQRTADSLNHAESNEFREIRHHLAEFLGPLQSAKIVTPCTFFGIDGYRYFDNTFPYILLFEIVNDAKTERDGLLVHLLLPATTDPPTQVRN